MPELTHTQLKRAVLAMAKTVSRDAEAIRTLAKEIDDEARDTARVGDIIGAIRVDTATVGETRELSKIMAGLSEASIQYATGASTASSRAQAVHDEAQRTHDGIQEAFRRSPVDLRDVNREWFRQE